MERREQEGHGVDARDRFDVGPGTNQELHLALVPEADGEAALVVVGGHRRAGALDDGAGGERAVGGVQDLEEFGGDEIGPGRLGEGRGDAVQCVAGILHVGLLRHGGVDGAPRVARLIPVCRELALSGDAADRVIDAPRAIVMGLPRGIAGRCQGAGEDLFAVAVQFRRDADQVGNNLRDERHRGRNLTGALEELGFRELHLLVEEPVTGASRKVQHRVGLRERFVDVSLPGEEVDASQG